MMLSCRILEAASGARLRFIPSARMICIRAPDVQEPAAKMVLSARYAQDSEKNTVHKRKNPARWPGLLVSCITYMRKYDRMCT